MLLQSTLKNRHLPLQSNCYSARKTLRNSAQRNAQLPHAVPYSISQERHSKISHKLAPLGDPPGILNICSLGERMLRVIKTLVPSLDQELFRPWHSSLMAQRIQTEEGNRA